MFEARVCECGEVQRGSAAVELPERPGSEVGGRVVVVEFGAAVQFIIIIVAVTHIHLAEHRLHDLFLWELRFCGLCFPVGYRLLEAVFGQLTIKPAFVSQGFDGLWDVFVLLGGSQYREYFRAGCFVQPLPSERVDVLPLCGVVVAVAIKIVGHFWGLLLRVVATKPAEKASDNAQGKPRKDRFHIIVIIIIKRCVMGKIMRYDYDKEIMRYNYKDR